MRTPSHRLALAGFLALSACLSAAPAAAGQQSTPDDIKKKLIDAGFGPSNPSMEIYTPLLAAVPKTGIKVTKDISYGTLPRQKLDVFQPAALKPLAAGADAAGAPVFVFDPYNCTYRISVLNRT